MMSMRVAVTVALAASAGAALVIVGMMFAPSRSSITNVLYPPTTTPTPTQTATPTDTPLPTVTETPNPDPLQSSCAVFELAAARLLDEYDEQSRGHSSELAPQYALAWAIVTVAIMAHGRPCVDVAYDWTDLRRRFSFVKDQVKEQFANAERLRELEEGESPYALSTTRLKYCVFYATARAVLLSIVLQLEQPESPDHRLLGTIDDMLAHSLWEPAQRQWECPGTSKLKRPARKRK